MLFHPENGVPLTDRIGRPVDVGDTVIIARKSSRYGGAKLVEATIKRITPLVIHPRHGGSTAIWHSTGRRSYIPLVREDQLSKSHQTEYFYETPDGSPPYWRNAFVATVELPDEARLRTVPFGQNLVVKPTYKPMPQLSAFQQAQVPYAHAVTS